MNAKASVLTSKGAFWFLIVRKGGECMLFTDGKDREYERMMREIPHHHRETIKIQTSTETKKDRDCPHCLYYMTKGKRCRYNYCIVFSK